MKVVVTGAGGFVGRHLLAQLTDQHDVLAQDLQLPSLPNTVLAVPGTLQDPATLAQISRFNADAVIHLATVPGGAAERDPALAWLVNVEASRQLIEAVARHDRPPRFVFASSIAVFGDPLPQQISDATPPAPRLIYGAHKLLIEEWLHTQTRRGEISGIALRLPGVIARPRGPSGMKSAFLSDLFHALRAGESISVPVSSQATTLLTSVGAVCTNLVHAMMSRDTGVVNLPALRVKMVDLIEHVAAATDASIDLIRWNPDTATEAQFGAYPPLDSSRAHTLGFTHDGGLDSLVRSALSTL